MISSARMISLNTGPFTTLNSAFPASYIVVPVISVGSVSGVNCILEKPASTDYASAFAKVVLPTPGTSSKRTCPPASKATKTLLITVSFPMNLFSILSFISEIMLLFINSLLLLRYVTASVSHFFSHRLQLFASACTSEGVFYLQPRRCM